MLRRLLQKTRRILGQDIKYLGLIASAVLLLLGWEVHQTIGSQLEGQQCPLFEYTTRNHPGSCSTHDREDPEDSLLQGTLEASYRKSAFPFTPKSTTRMERETKLTQHSL